MATNRVAAVAASSIPAHGFRKSVSLPASNLQTTPHAAAGASWRRSLEGRCPCGSRIVSKNESASPRHKWPNERLSLAKERENLKQFAVQKRRLQFQSARSVKVLALGENGREDAQELPEPSDGWRQRSRPSNPSTSYGSESNSLAESLEPAESGGMEDVERVYTSEEIGDYESDRRRQYRADVESGARGIASVFRAMGNSVTWGVSSTGRGLSAIQSGVQNRWRRARNPRRPEPASEQDPDSLGDSDSDSEWDGSEPAVLLASTETPAAVESEAFVRQQGDASTSDSGRPGAEDTWEEPWETIKRWWNNPAFFRFRVSLSMANLTMALPAFIARVSAMYPTFVAGLHSQLLTSQLSLPIMAPLLFGGGIAFKAIMSNLGFVLPRLAMAGGVLWILWATNYAMQEAIAHLRNNGAIDRRISNVLVLTVELVASTIGLVTILSSVGVRISSLLLPGFAAVALAGKDVWHNYFAGFFLFAAQPFRPGDSVALLCGAGVAPPSPTSAVPPGWFEGVCESVDLRYTVLRNGRQRLLVPNAHFVNREFLVTDAGPVVTRAPPTARTDSPRGVKNGRAKGTPGGTNGPPGMPGQKVSPNGQDKRGGFMPTSSSNGGPGPMPSGPGIAVPWGK